jgi:hypothetical protein
MTTVRHFIEFEYGFFELFYQTIRVADGIVPGNISINIEKVSFGIFDSNLLIPCNSLQGNCPFEGEGRVRGIRSSFLRYPAACCGEVHYIQMQCQRTQQDSYNEPVQMS